MSLKPPTKEKILFSQPLSQVVRIPKRSSSHSIASQPSFLTQDVLITDPVFSQPSQLSMTSDKGIRPLSRNHSASKATFKPHQLQFSKSLERLDDIPVAKKSERPPKKKLQAAGYEEELPQDTFFQGQTNSIAP